MTDVLKREAAPSTESVGFNEGLLGDGGFTSLARGMLQNRRQALVAGVLAALLTFGAATLIPRKYRAEVTILPAAGLGSSLQPNLGNLSGIAQTLGFRFGATSGNSQLYQHVLTSRRVIYALLAQRFLSPKTGQYTTLLDMLPVYASNASARVNKGYEYFTERMLSLRYDPRTELTTVAVTFWYPETAREIANDLATQLDIYNRSFNRTVASAQRHFAEERLNDARTRLYTAQDSLRAFLERNRTFAQAPALQLQYENLRRQVEFAEQLVLQLQAQFETTRMEEVRNTPIVNVLDPATRPTKPVWPPRLALSLGAFLLTVFFVSWKGSRAIRGTSDDRSWSDLLRESAQALRKDSRDLLALLRRRVI